MNAITESFTGRKRIRKSFGRLPEVAPMPNLIDVQRASYEAFLQMEVKPDARAHAGLQEVFKSVFPIDDFAGRGRLEFVQYELEEPKYDVEECIQRGLTFAAPLKVRLRLIVWDVDEDTGSRSVRDIKEQDVYMGDMPLMTDNGTFIINGTERVIVSQMHRSPGVFFDHDKGKTHSSGKYLFAARVIPYRGSWLDFEFDAKDICYVRIDRKRKLPATTLLLALDSVRTEGLRAEKTTPLEPSEVRGMDAEEILAAFYGRVVFARNKTGWSRPFDPDSFRGVKLIEPLVDAKTGQVVAERDTKMTPRAARKIAEAGTTEILVSHIDLLGRFVAEDLVNMETGEIWAEAGEELTEPKLALIDELGLDRLPTLAIDQAVGPWIRNTLVVDKNTNRDEALMDIYRVMRPGEPPTPDTAETLFRGLFFDSERYDLSSVGRVKMNMRLGFSAEEVPDTIRTLRKQDIVSTMRVLLELKDGRGQIDDIDNLGNRRVRSVGELMENQYRVGLLRMERAIKERMGSVDIDTVMPHDLINAKPAAAAVREFFGSSQLSQFMDQTNPLSEVTHKRRLSALGPGGLTRERAGFEVRDVHPTHYGRICPIETPEGPNIGLINSLATFAKVNKYGFIETPYRLVRDGKIVGDPRYLSAMEEEKLVVAQADADVDPTTGAFRSELVSVRQGGDFRLVKPEEVTAIDVSPKQLVSVAAALIPFLENDDANRALMGSNMQRQAVPLVRADAPLVGTGMEAAVARDSGATIVARSDGLVDSIDGARIVVRATGDDGTTRGVDIYRLRKFQRSNQSTCINQRPLVKVGDKVNAGEIIADGPSTELGELALGLYLPASHKLHWVSVAPWHEAQRPAPRPPASCYRCLVS
jgi:DNA-directed RNA polymerase subunit beta